MQSPDFAIKLSWKTLNQDYIYLFYSIFIFEGGGKKYEKENNVKNYFENSILNADGYALRMRLSLGFFVLDTVLIFLLVL